MMDIDVGLLQWSINVLIKKLQGEQLNISNISNKKLAEELHKPIKKRKRNYTHLLQIIFGGQIQQICN